MTNDTHDEPVRGTHEGRDEELIKALTSSQNALYAFILTLLPDRDRARDVLQETNLVVWRKSAEFSPDSSFWAWATTIARYQVLAHYRDASRDRLVFDEALLSNLAAAALQLDDGEARRAALRVCLGQLPASQRALLAARYRQEVPLEELSRVSGRTVAALKMALVRIRRALLECIRRRLATEASAT